MMDKCFFLSVPYNFALQLNIDLFQPYEHTQFGRGYDLTIMNLPRSEHFLRENVILVFYLVQKNHN